MLHLILAALLFTEYLKHVETSPIRESSKALKESWFTKALQYMESYPETLEELMSKDSAVLEGDMMLPSDRNAVKYTWPTREIPYVISPELASRTDDFLSAMKMVSENTCVSFRKRTFETDYLLFKPSKGCASYVGFIGGEQDLFIGPPCVVGNIVHELLHSLGFYHEHTRTDREQYITILPHNVMAGKERNFRKQQGETFDLPYDIKSIMHYGSGFFSANGLPTIIPNVDAEEMGQRVKMTQMDIKRVRHLYSCDSTGKQTEKEHSDVEQKEDTTRRILLHDVKTTNQSHDSANKHTTAAPSDSLKKAAAATRGQNKTNGEKSLD